MTRQPILSAVTLLLFWTLMIAAQEARKASENNGLAATPVKQDKSQKAEAGDQASKRREQAADGSVRLLAKDVTIHGATVRYEPQPHKNTVGYLTDAKDWVSWNFKLNNPGTFKVELTQACGKGSGGSDYTVTIGDEVLRDTVPDTGSFTNFVNRTIGQVKLGRPGDYMVSVKPIKKPGLAVMDLRAITLKPLARE